MPTPNQSAIDRIKARAFRYSPNYRAYVTATLKAEVSELYCQGQIPQGVYDFALGQIELADRLQSLEPVIALGYYQGFNLGR